MEARSMMEGSHEFVEIVKSKLEAESGRETGERICLWIGLIPRGWIRLIDYLDRRGPFPVEPYYAASITQQITSAVLFLHQFKMVHGEITPASIVIDNDGVAHLLPPLRIRSTATMVDDIRSIGVLLMRLATGQSYLFPPAVPFPVCNRLIQLAAMILDTQMTAGEIRYHPVLTRFASEKSDTFFFNH